MRVLMLGWEFPPFISGGLGTACHGLTRALSRQDVQVLFILPRDPGAEHATHVTLLSASEQRVNAAGESIPDDPALANVLVKAVPSRLGNPYQSAGGQLHHQTDPGRSNAVGLLGLGERPTVSAGNSAAHYDGDLIGETQRYAEHCLALARDESFDVIHAHDWMTYPAGLALAAATGKPLVVHVHSTEFDRSGINVNQQVYDIERRGMHGACRVITVSFLTKSICQHRYAVSPEHIDVIYNGVERNGQTNGQYQHRTGIKRGEKIVLFLGRITMQKGPEYFVGAAKKVLKKFDNVKFVMAGTGDMARDVIELAAHEGIGHKVLFTGFLRGDAVERVFDMADVYVMPSVSEPFGIAPLEAISHDVPVIVSKTSGVAEVLTHALKVDFWDTNDIADKILAVLRHPPLSSTLRQHADMEVRTLTWAGAATKCLRTYQTALQMIYAA